MSVDAAAHWGHKCIFDLEQSHRAVLARGGKVYLGWECGAPSSETALLTAEKTLGREIPKPLREWFLECTGKLHFCWQLPRGVVDGRDEFLVCATGSGGVVFSVREMLGAEDVRQGWASSSFNDTNDVDGRLWRHSFAFHNIANGDLLALDLSKGEDPPVIYLDHEGGDRHGLKLGKTFREFMEAWCALATVGPEHWNIQWFRSPQRNGLDSESPLSKKWREWLAGA